LVFWLLQHIDRTHSRCTSFSNKLMRILVLSQFDGPQIIARIVLGSISSYLLLHASPCRLSSFAISCRSSCISSAIAVRISCSYYELCPLDRLFKGARSNKMYLVLCPFDIQDLSAEQLQYVPKVILLRVYGDYWPCMGQASGTRESGSGDSNLSSLQRALQLVVAVDA